MQNAISMKRIFIDRVSIEYLKKDGRNLAQ